MATQQNTTSPVVYIRQSVSGSFGSWRKLLIADNNLSDVSSATTSRTNLSIFMNTALASSTNFNSIVTEGAYYTIDSSSTNAPFSSAYWYLQVRAYSSSSWIMQIATRLDIVGANTYIRTQTNGTWNAWRQVVFPDDQVAWVRQQYFPLTTLS